jgi:hypothetical protein
VAVMEAAAGGLEAEVVVTEVMAGRGGRDGGRGGMSGGAMAVEPHRHAESLSRGKEDAS